MSNIHELHNLELFQVGLGTPPHPFLPISWIDISKCLPYLYKIGWVWLDWLFTKVNSISAFEPSHIVDLNVFLFCWV